jgi:hypothetical protein
LEILGFVRFVPGCFGHCPASLRKFAAFFHLHANLPKEVARA